MIIVRVELHSAVTGQVTELARAHISNIGGTDAAGDYECITLRGRSKATLDRHVPQRRGKVLGHPRLREHVWNLVAKALTGMGYGRAAAPPESVTVRAPAPPGLVTKPLKALPLAIDEPSHG